MADSILNTIKQLLGVSLEDTAFDLDILVLINAAIAKLHQAGVGPQDPILVVDQDSEWSSFSEDLTILALSKQFILFSVKIAFDPPGTSYHLTSLNALMEESIWRLKEEADPYVPEVPPVEL